MPVDTGFRPGFNRFFYRMDFGVDRSALTIPQLLQARLVDPEEVGDLVDDGDLDLTLQFGEALAHLLQRFLEDEDRVRMERGRGEERVLLERRSLVKPQERFVRRIAHLLQHLPRGAFLHGEDDVIHPLPDLCRDTVEGAPNRPVELFRIQFHDPYFTV